MEFYVYLILGFLVGIHAGMGLGGGTVTIPLLTIVVGVAQKLAQTANLFAFVPMSLPTLKMHEQQGLLKTEGLFWTVVPALLTSSIGALIAAALPGDWLRKGFGLFLIGLSFFTLRGALQEKPKKKDGV
ncbi:MAG: sulfite exporter TauE/SafE family protein [Clostridia bacterium]|nr:sulfite exporter TauE/SafE family protein [Clostridia bacterium]